MLSSLGTLNIALFAGYSMEKGSNADVKHSKEITDNCLTNIQ